MKQGTLLPVVLIALGAALAANGYQFIVSNGTPSVVAPVSLASAAIALDTSESAIATSGTPIEGRYFTEGISAGIGIDPTKTMGFQIFIR